MVLMHGARNGVVRQLPRMIRASSTTSVAASSTPVASAESAKTRRIGALLFSGICGGTACLCGWQLQRYQWKLQLIEERHIALASSSQPLLALVPQPGAGLPEDAEYQRVTVEGEFDHARQVLLGPRSAPAGAGVGTGAPAGAANTSGWDVLTPLRCADGVRVIVNRGWVPREAVEAVDQPTGPQTVSGVLKAGEKINKFATNDAAMGRYIWLDLPTIAEQTASSPLLVVAAIEDTGDKSHPQKKRWPHARPVDSFLQFHVMPDKHLVYAATWASLSAAGTLITYMRFIR